MSPSKRNAQRPGYAEFWSRQFLWAHDLIQMVLASAMWLAISADKDFGEWLELFDNFKS